MVLVLVLGRSLLMRRVGRGEKGGGRWGSGRLEGGEEVEEGGEGDAGRLCVRG